MSVLIGIGFIAILAWAYITVDLEAGGECELPDILCDAGKMMGFPAGWLTISGIISYIVCPGALTLIIFYMFSRAIFGWLSDSSKIHFALAFIVGLMLTFGRVFQKFVFAMYTSLGIIAAYVSGVLGFVAFIFLLKTKIAFGGGKVKKAVKEDFDEDQESYDEQIKKCDDEIKEGAKEIKKLYEIAEKAGMDKGALEIRHMRIVNRVEKWKREKEKLKKLKEESERQEKDTLKDIDETVKEAKD